MGSLFKTPTVKTTQPVNPADIQNLQANQRLRRLDSGGSQATLLGQSMATSSQLGGPRATLTGMG